jgi:hypothetical protein
MDEVDKKKTQKMKIGLLEVGVIIFDLVRFLSEKLTKPVSFLKKLKPNRFKSTGLVILEQKPA